MAKRGKYKCEECEALGTPRAFTTPQALGRHRSVAHGIVGTSTSAVRSRQRRGARVTQRTNAATTRRSGGRKRKVASSRTKTVPAFNRDKAIALVAPNGGAKLSYGLLDDLIQWADEGARLHAVATVRTRGRRTTV